jgi:PKD repeat protein
MRRAVLATLAASLILMAGAGSAQATVITATPVDFTVAEQSAFNGAVATFADDNPAAMPSDFTATIDWGDGSPTTQGTIVGSCAEFVVLGQHTYADEGSFTVTVTISDVPPGTGTATATDTATVTEADALSGSPITFSVPPGVSFTTTVATFSDSLTSAVPADFTATIDWGDATTSAGTVSGGSGSFSVSGTHTYAAAGTYPVTVTLSDDAPGTATATVTSTAKVLTGLSVAAVNFSVPERTVFNGTVANFSDSDTSRTAAGFTATIDWGDSTTTPGTIAGGSGVFTVSGQHTYADEGTFTTKITVSETASPMRTASATGTATATEADMLTPGSATVFSAVVGFPFTGTVATFTDSDTSNTASDFTATIDWGDTTVTAGTVSGGAGSFTVSGTHTYASAGNFPVTVTLTDDPPGTATATASGTARVSETRGPIGTIVPLPAATLLLPYFEVDLNNPNGLSTLLSINNAAATAVLAHVTMWSDLSVHVLDFNVYLTGYDVQTINLRDIIVNGNLPQTASAGQDPNDNISPKGPKSGDINVLSCHGILPINPLPASFIQHMQNSLTGKASALLGGLCAGQALGDNVARGYITVDTVNACTLLSPGDSGYFGPGGVVTNENVLWGDFFIVNVPQNFAQGGPLVHIAASSTDPSTSTPNNYTFYGRYVGWNASDNRQPLATTFATRFQNGGVFSGGSDLLVWRDSKVNQAPFTCPADRIVHRPPYYPLGQEGIVIFDEQEQTIQPPTCQVSPCQGAPTLVPFPAETQRVHVAGPALPVVPFNFGWLYLDLNTTISGNPNPPVDPAAAQAWVIATDSSNGHFAVGVNGIQLDNASAANHFVP